MKDSVTLDAMFSLLPIEQKDALMRCAVELQRALEKHPQWPDDNIHRAGIVTEECGELMKAAIQAEYEGGDPNEMVSEAVQTGAMAIRFLITEKTFSEKSNQQPLTDAQISHLDKSQERLLGDLSAAAQANPSGFQNPSNWKGFLEVMTPQDIMAEALVELKADEPSFVPDVVIMNPVFAVYYKHHLPWRNSGEMCFGAKVVVSDELEPGEAFRFTSKNDTL